MSTWIDYEAGRSTSKSTKPKKVHAMEEVTMGERTVIMPLCRIDDIRVIPGDYDGEAPNACQRCARLRRARWDDPDARADETLAEVAGEMGS